MLSFLTNWNDFLWPVYVLFSPKQLTLPPGLAILQNAYSTDYAVVMAGGVVASILVLIVFVFAQKYVIRGVSRSGLKGLCTKSPSTTRLFEAGLFTTTTSSGTSRIFVQGRLKG